MKKIVIDPGHGGQDRSNLGPTGYVEADGVLDIGIRLRKLLEDNGFQVKMTRQQDITVSLQERSRIANEWGGELFLSLHTNAAADKSANGIETYHSYNGIDGDKYREEAKRVAEIVQKSLVEETGLRDRGVKTRLISNSRSSFHNMDYYAVIRSTRMPALIIEMGFHTNPEEEALLKTKEFRQRLAKAIFDGIQQAYPQEEKRKHGNEDNLGDNPLEDTVNFKRGEFKVKIEDKEKLVRGYILDGRFYVPIRFLEDYNYQVNYESLTKTIIIEKNS